MSNDEEMAFAEIACRNAERVEQLKKEMRRQQELHEKITLALAFLGVVAGAALAAVVNVIFG